MLQSYEQQHDCPGISRKNVQVAFTRLYFIITFVGENSGLTNEGSKTSIAYSP